MNHLPLIGTTQSNVPDDLTKKGADVTDQNSPGSLCIKAFSGFIAAITFTYQQAISLNTNIGKTGAILKASPSPCTCHYGSHVNLRALFPEVPAALDNQNYTTNKPVPSHSNAPYLQRIPKKPSRKIRIRGSTSRDLSLPAAAFASPNTAARGAQTFDRCAQAQEICPTAWEHGT